MFYYISSIPGLRFFSRMTLKSHLPYGTDEMRMNSRIKRILTKYEA